MKEQQYRKTLIENKWNLMQSRLTIRKAYPNVEEIKIKLDFNYNGAITTKNSLIRFFKPEDKDYFEIDCINQECIQSDLDLSCEIKNMISKKTQNITGQKICNGFQDFERFKAKNYHCLAEMNFEIEIKYKNNAC